MSADSQNILSSFDALPLVEQREIMAVLLQKASQWDNPPLTDDELARLADDVFLELDRREATNGQ